MEPLLHAVSQQVSLALQVVAILVVAVVSLRALVSVCRIMVARRAAGDMHAVWLDHARWLVVALTFQLAADIVSTSFSPTWDEVGRLASVAAIRTFLSFFLDREMERTRAFQHAAATIARHRRAATIGGDTHE